MIENYFTVEMRLSSKHNKKYSKQRRTEKFVKHLQQNVLQK